MHPKNAQEVLAVLTIPPTLETQLIDWLLAMETSTGFSSCTVNGHSSRHDRLSIAEQVVGRQRRVQFQVQLDGEALDSFLNRLGADFRGADLHYWVTPLLASGRLDDDTAKPADDDE